MQFSAAQIAPIIGGRIEGDASVLVSDFGKIEEAKPADLAFLANPSTKLLPTAHRPLSYSLERTLLLENPLPPH